MPDDSRLNRPRPFFSRFRRRRLSSLLLLLLLSLLLLLLRLRLLLLRSSLSGLFLGALYCVAADPEPPRESMTAWTLAARRSSMSDVAVASMADFISRLASRAMTPFQTARHAPRQHVGRESGW